MNSLENKSIVKRLGNGECPHCGHLLNYIGATMFIGDLDKNGYPKTFGDTERFEVQCPICGYTKEALQVGINIIPIDRIIPWDKDWDKPYLHDNTLINCKEGENPFKKG